VGLLLLLLVFLVFLLLLFMDLCRPETKTTAAVARVPVSLSPKFWPCPFIEKIVSL
jgi:hypothetical protein